MINPWIKVGDGNLMASQALQKLRVRTADSIRIRESLCQLFIEESYELVFFGYSRSCLVREAIQDSTVVTSAWLTTHSVLSRAQYISTKPQFRRDGGGSRAIARAFDGSEIQPGIQ